MSGAVSVVAVALSGQPAEETKPAERPAHYANDAGTRFRNPWPSFQQAGFREFLKFFTGHRTPPMPPNVQQLLGFRKPDWESSKKEPEKLKATWLGHACFLVELPTPPGATRGPRILFDPVFSNRCSPTQWIGPSRYTPPPCPVEEMPEVDAIVISHNHYDHLDTPTIQSLVFSRPSPSSSSPPHTHVFAPLRNEYLFKSLSIPPTNYHCLDWWSSRDITVQLPSHAANASATDPTPIPTTFRLTCTPAQHWANRGPFDRFTTLWSSWAIESNPLSSKDNTDDAHLNSSASPNKKIWFGGDTGYRSVKDGEDENKVPVCPAFKEIGERFGGFDLALIPIGAYSPRAALSPMHCAPQDSVCIFKDIKAKKAIGMHWGTWVLSWEGIMEPAELLKKECVKAGVEDDAFGVCGLGEMTFV